MTRLEIGELPQYGKNTPGIYSPGTSRDKCKSNSNSKKK